MANLFSLDGKTVMVTGASSGIGAAVASMAAERGAIVVATARNEVRLQRVVGELEGAGHTHRVADLTDGGDRKALVENVAPLDGVVHCAGMSAIVPARFWTEETWERVNAINHKAPLLLSRELLFARKIRPAASLVFLSSVSAHVPSKGYGVYAASKAALQAAAKVLALETAPRQIRANCISPGWVETPMVSSQQELSTSALDEYRSRYPLGTGRPEDVAAAAVFLLAPASRWMTGVDLLLEGGICLT